MIKGKIKVFPLLLPVLFTVQPCLAQRRVDVGNIALFSDIDTLCGAQASILSSGVRSQMRGLLAGGLTTAADGDMRGVQLAGISNIVTHGNGMQAALFTNLSSQPFRGVQLSGVSNTAMGVKRGVQLAAAANICSSSMRGVQLAAYNYADTLSGSQVGLFNVCLSHPRGVQVGLFNYSRDTVAHKIGLVNVNPKTQVDLMAYGGNSTKVNLAVRFRNRSTYSILGVGTHFFGLDQRFSGAIYYRIGQYFPVNRRLSLSGDLGFAHVESFEENSSGKAQRLYSLQARVNADWQLDRYTGAFLSVGYGDTRYYRRARRYRHRPIVEAGLTFRLAPVRSLVPQPAGGCVAEVEQADSSGCLGVAVYAYDDPTRQKKHPWRAALEDFGINVGVQSFDRFVLNADFAQISWQSVKHNIQNGFVWDNDQFSTNLFAHPYHGGLYFNAARSNRLTFWASVPYSFCGSLMWETACEIEPPAINDLIATTVGGVAIGEVTHRISDLVFDDRQRGFPRFLRELLGTVICPIKGLNRLLTGDAWKVRGQYYKYHDYDRLPVEFAAAVGYRYLADNNALFRGDGTPYVNFFLAYGDPFNEEENKPYDYFTADVSFSLGGNQPLVTGVHLLGRLWSAPVDMSRDVKTEFGIFQHFNYYDSSPVKNGSSVVPYRISEAAAVGPGVIYQLPEVGSLTRLEQRVFLDAILLGGSMSDYYNVIDRDYNMGSGYSVKLNTLMEFGRVGKFCFGADYYRIFTWKGYEGKDLEHTDPLYLNAQGDKGNASLLVMNARFLFSLSDHFNLDISASHYWRDTYYKYYNKVKSRTFDVHIGLQYQL